MRLIAGVHPDLTGPGQSDGQRLDHLRARRPANLMDLLGTEVTMDGTCYANPYAIAAARRTIDLLEAGGIEHLKPARPRLREGVAQAIVDSGVTANVTGGRSGRPAYARRETRGGPAGVRP